jgi:hypothetical protein
MIAAHGEVIALRVGIVTAFYLAHAPPVERRGIAVLFVARHHAALAADALGHVEVKAVLLARFQRTLRNQRRGLHLDLNQRAGGRGKQRAFHQWQGSQHAVPHAFAPL